MFLYSMFYVLMLSNPKFCSKVPCSNALCWSILCSTAPVISNVVCPSVPRSARLWFNALCLTC